MTSIDANSYTTTPGDGAHRRLASTPVPRSFYGKYRGEVIENVDPEFRGRVIPLVEEVAPFPLGWAMPCVPYAGEGVGFYAIPPIGAKIWVEFEGGNPSKPIWVGCFWELEQAPLVTPEPTMVILKTMSTTLILNDLPGEGGLALELTPPAVDAPISITMDSEGIQIETETLFDLTCQATNITCDEFSLESDNANIAGESLTIESLSTNIAGEELSVEAGDTNIAGESLTVEAAETNISGAEVSIESLDTNIASAEFSVETAETNIASVATTVEGVAEFTGVALEDGMPIMVIPI